VVGSAWEDSQSREERRNSVSKSLSLLLRARDDDAMEEKKGLGSRFPSLEASWNKKD